jgi:hypothetical protein
MSENSRTFLGDFFFYVGRARLFRAQDWLVYSAWVGLMVSLLAVVSAFVIFGACNGIRYPAYVWDVPAGIAIFVVAIGIDTIGHRTAYREALRQGEALVHHITIAAGISSVVLLCVGYTYRLAFGIPAFAMVGLSIFYSAIDEAMHWIRFARGDSDRIEMWSHFFIFVGHTIMVLSWCYWFYRGYPGVAETLALLR